MSAHEKSPKLSDVKAGDILVVDDAFTCLRAREEVTVYGDADGLFVRCAGPDSGLNKGADHGKPATDVREEIHYLSGQEDDNGRLTGMFRKGEYPEFVS